MMETQQKPAEKPDPTSDNHSGGDAATKGETKGPGTTDAGGGTGGDAGGNKDWASDLNMPQSGEALRAESKAQQGRDANGDSARQLTDSAPPADGQKKT